MEKKFRYLVPGDYMADPAVHVFDGKLYIYPSHDRESGVEENDNGDHLWLVKMGTIICIFH